MILLPAKTGDGQGKEALSWKIWILVTWVDNLDVQPEDESLLQSPARELDGLKAIETDVFIIGGGNA